MNVTTTSTKEVQELNFDDMLEAIKSLPPAPKKDIVKIEVSKKDKATIEKYATKVEPKNPALMQGYLGSLYGVPIIVKPGLKKAKIYFRHNNV